MIETLTAEQEKQIEEYYERWLKIGYDSKTDKEKSEKAVFEIYFEIKLPKPKIKWFSSPVLAGKWLRKNGFEITCESGNFEAFFVGPRAYCAEVLGIDFGEDKKIFEAYSEYVRNCGFAFFYETLAVLCPKPRIERKNERMKVFYSNDKSFKPLYFLNEVKVPGWLYNTPPGKLDIKKYYQEKNIEIRREFFRKIGGKLFLKKSKAKKISEWSNDDIIERIGKASVGKNVYSLYLLDIGLDEKYKYLKMEQTDKNGLRSTYVMCVPDQAVETAEDAFYSIHPHIQRGTKIILS